MNFTECLFGTINWQALSAFPDICRYAIVLHRIPINYKWHGNYKIDVKVITVAQTRVTGPEDIYDTLVGDTQFMSYVGDYYFVGGTTLNSVVISTPGQQVPNLENINGLEVIIHDIGVIGRQDYLTSDPDILVTYQVFLILWNGATGTTLTNAGIRLAQLFSGVTSVKIDPGPIESKILTQVQFLIPQNAVIMP